MKCSKCGKKLKNQVEFCPNCGAEILPKKQNARKSLSKKAKTVIACVCIVALLISGTVGGLYFFKNHTDNLTDLDSNYISFTEGFTDVCVTDEKSALEAIKSVEGVIGIENADDELKISSTNTVDSDTYYRFGQYYNGIPVYGRDIVVAADGDGTALALTGNFVKIEDVQKYDLDKIDKDNTVVYGLNPSKICTVLCESIEGEEYLVFTDIKTGDVVDRLCITYTASEKNYPYQEADGTYSLYDSKRNIRILNSNGKKLEKTDFLPVEDGKYQRIFYTGKNKDKRQNIFSNYWGKCEIEYIVNDNISVVKANVVDGFDSSATQLMDNVALTYDFYYEKLDRSGFDDQNGLIFASYNDNYDNGNNAYASVGSLISFGKHSNLSVDLIAHEYTHSVEFMISNMSYEGKSGAIMEGYSDIFGEIVEDYADGKMNNNCDWINGNRNIKEPLKTKNPEIYEGKNWKTTEDKLDKEGNSKNDHGHVHNNSTVISHTAYLMNIGIDGTESQKIDTETLAKIWYKALFVLQSDATFSQLRNAVELSARIMKENGELTEEQYSAVSQAFEAVGISNNVFTYFKTVKNDFDLLVLNPEGKKDLEAKIKIYKCPNSFFAFPLEYDTEKMNLVEETIFNSLSPDIGEHFKLDNGIYIVEIIDNLSDINESIKMELKVDGNDEKAIDKITVYTDFNEITTVILNKEQQPKRLIADEDDFEELTLLLKNIDICGYPFEYSATDPQAYETVLSEMLGPYTTVPLYEYIYGKEAVYVDATNGCFKDSPEAEHDPLNKFGDFYRYGKVLADEIDWIIKNVFNISPDRLNATIMNGENCLVYYFENYYYFSCGDGGDVGVYPVIKNKSVDANNIYTIKYDLISKGDNLTYEGTFEIVCELKSISGKRQWSFTSIVDKSRNENSQSEITNNNTENKKDSYVGNQTAEQLRKSIIGYWEGFDSTSTYEFTEDGTAYWSSQKQQPGNYTISEDKTLTISFPWTTNRYTWSDLSFDEFHKDHDHDEYFWYMTDTGVLMLNGTKYYRDGIIMHDYNTSGDLLAHISGVWIDETGNREYRIFDNGKWEENRVVLASKKMLVSRTNLDSGTINLVDDCTAQLVQDVHSAMQIPGLTELKYDKKQDKIYIGGSNNCFSRAKYE